MRKTDDEDRIVVRYRYRVSAKVRVLYDPRNPRESALERDPPAGPVFFMVVGIIFTLAGLFIPLE